MLTTESAASVMLESAKAINARFVKEAIADWEKTGIYERPDLSMWVACYLQQAWAELVSAN